MVMDEATFRAVMALLGAISVLMQAHDRMPLPGRRSPRAGHREGKEGRAARAPRRGRRPPEV